MIKPPAYIQLHQSGELPLRKEAAWEGLSCCELCAHECRVNRSDGKQGICRSDATVQISGYAPHYGEEDVLVGTGGSGTIFFSGCNLKCVFCQNWEISHLHEGKTISSDELAEIMLELQNRGCHNINFVSPSHYVPQILTALEAATGKGLKLPLIYNAGGYESINTLKLLDGIIDIYMPDVKFGVAETGMRLTGAKNYPQVVKAALKEMHRQVGDLKVDVDGIARRGLLIRHLILPENLAGTDEIVNFIATEISPNTYINLMDQYYPAYQAKQYPPLDRRLTNTEFAKAIQIAREAGLERFA